jgi:hypothetical protein
VTDCEAVLQVRFSERERWSSAYQAYMEVGHKRYLLDWICNKPHNLIGNSAMAWIPMMLFSLMFWFVISCYILRFALRAEEQHKQGWCRAHCDCSARRPPEAPWDCYPWTYKRSIGSGSKMVWLQLWFAQITWTQYTEVMSFISLHYV